MKSCMDLNTGIYLKPFKLIAFTLFDYFTHSQTFQSHIHSSLPFLLLGKLDRVMSAVCHEAAHDLWVSGTQCLGALLGSSALLESSPHFTACFSPSEHSLCRCATYTNQWFCLMSCINHIIQHVSLLLAPGFVKIHNQSIPVAGSQQQDYAWEFKCSVSVIYTYTQLSATSQHS